MSRSAVFFPSLRQSEPRVDIQLGGLKLLEELRHKREFDAQAEEFVDKMTPDPERFERIYTRVKYDLRHVLSSALGSSLSIKPVGWRYAEVQLTSGNVEVHIEVFGKPKKSMYSLIAAHLHNSSFFSSAHCVCFSDVPTIKCIHNYTGMKLELFLSQSMDKTDLIKAFLSADAKVKTAFMVLKYWAQIRGITGVKHGLTEYAFTLLFIFFLQRKKDYPNVDLLQYGTSPMRGCRWNTTIRSIKLAEHQKVQNVEDLLKQFFDFYLDFDYKSHIICPYYGVGLSKACFVQMEFLELLFKKQKDDLELIQNMPLDSAMCVQDPIELDRNVCLMREYRLAEFRLECCVAQRIMKREEGRLEHLFAPFENTSITSELYLYLTRSSVDRILEANKLNGPSEVLKKWHEQTRKFLMEALTYVFGFNVIVSNRTDVRDMYEVSALENSWLYDQEALTSMEEAMEPHTSNLKRRKAVQNLLKTQFPQLMARRTFDTLVIIRFNEKAVKLEIIPKFSKDEKAQDVAHFVCKNLMRWFYEREGYIPDEPIYSKLV